MSENDRSGREHQQPKVPMHLDFDWPIPTWMRIGPKRAELELCAEPFELGQALKIRRVMLRHGWRERADSRNRAIRWAFEKLKQARSELDQGLKLERAARKSKSKSEKGIIPKFRNRARTTLNRWQEKPYLIKEPSISSSIQEQGTFTMFKYGAWDERVDTSKEHWITELAADHKTLKTVIANALNWELFKDTPGRRAGTPLQLFNEELLKVCDSLADRDLTRRTTLEYEEFKQSLPYGPGFEFFKAIFVATTSDIETEVLNATSWKIKERPPRSDQAIDGLLRRAIESVRTT